MVKKNTSNYYSNFNHYISCSHITLASPVFTLSRGHFVRPLFLCNLNHNISPNTLKFSLFPVFKISIFSLEKYMR